MSSMPPGGFVAAFSGEVLAADLPNLPPERRAAAVDFIGARVGGLPTPMRFGVGAVALATGVAGRVVGTRRVVAVLRRWPIPVLADYLRLVRSLGYAFVWEQWPASGPRGEAA
jgi:hypothetical protein